MVANNANEKKLSDRNTHFQGVLIERNLIDYIFRVKSPCNNNKTHSTRTN